MEIWESIISKYMSRTTIKGQVVVEFSELVEVTSDEVKEKICGIDQREGPT